MGKFKLKTTKIVEAITFDELVEYGRNNGANIVNEMPWSFEYMGLPVTHENDECYLIGSLDFTPNDVLLAEGEGEFYIQKLDEFNEMYAPVDSKVINTYLLEVEKRNGPNSFVDIVKVLELENGKLFEKHGHNSYRPMDRRDFNKAMSINKDSTQSIVIPTTTSSDREKMNNGVD